MTQELVDRLIAYREHNGVPYTKIAADLEVSPQTVSNWLKRGNVPLGYRDAVRELVGHQSVDSDITRLVEMLPADALLRELVNQLPKLSKGARIELARVLLKDLS